MSGQGTALGGTLGLALASSGHSPLPGALDHEPSQSSDLPQAATVAQSLAQALLVLSSPWRAWASHRGAEESVLTTRKPLQVTNLKPSFKCLTKAFLKKPPTEQELQTPLNYFPLSKIQGDESNKPDRN